MCALNAAVGHLIVNDTDDGGKVQKLKDFCKIIMKELSEDFVNKESMIYRFDLFFGNIKPTVDSFTKFVTCFVKKATFNDYFMQLHLDQLIWRHYISCNSVPNWNRFQAFCIFNRFCHAGSMLLSPTQSQFLLRKISSPELPEDHIDFGTFHQLVVKGDHELLNKLFQEFVLDIHHEDSQVKFRIKPDTSFQRKRIILTSNYIFVTKSSGASSEEGFFLGLMNQDDVQKRGRSIKSSTSHSTGQQQDFFAMVLASDSEAVVQKPQQNLFSKKKTTIISIKTKNEEVELSFNAEKDHFRIFQWTRNFSKAMACHRSKTTKLQEHLKQYNMGTNTTSKKPLERVQTCLPIMKD